MTSVIVARFSKLAVGASHSDTGKKTYANTREAYWYAKPSLYKEPRNDSGRGGHSANR